MKPMQLAANLAKLVPGILFLNLREVPVKIEEVARFLESISHSVEPKFLEMGDTLQVLYGKVSSLTHSIKDATRQLTGDEDYNLLRRAAGLVEEASHIIQRYQNQVSAGLPSVAALIKHLETLFSACGRIDRIATNLRMVGINIGVESTRSAEARSNFGVIAKEIIEFSESIVSVGDQIREDVLSAKRDEEKALENIYRGLSEFQHLSREASDTIRNSVAEIDTCMGIAGNVFNESGLRFEEISGKVGEIVVAIQFHDSMRQRVEHITAALTSAGRLILEKRDGPGTAGTRLSRLDDAKATVALQTGQLQDVILEIERIHMQSTGAFEAIEKQVVLLARNMASVCDHTSDDDLQDPFKRWVASLKHLVSLIGRADRLAGMIEESIARSANIAERFSRHLGKVQRIGFEAQIKAINAIIKSDHLGEKGRTLEVLAREMNTISRETDGFVASVKSKLNHMSDFAGELLQRSQTVSLDPEPPREGREMSSEMLSKGIEEIVRIQNRLKNQVGEAAREAEGLVSGIRNTRDGLAFLSANRPPRKTKASGTDKLKLAAAYTMQRERDVHKSLVPGGTDANSETAPPSPADTLDVEGNACPAPINLEDYRGRANDKKQVDDDDESFGDNVELF